METNFTTLEEAERALGEGNSWLNAQTAGSSLPNGTYQFGKVSFEDYSIINSEGTNNTGQYPTIELSGSNGHGTVTGKQLLGQGIAEGLTADKVVTESRKKSFYLKSTPFNPQFTGKPILALLAMQGNSYKLENSMIRVQTVFPTKGSKWTKAEATKAFGSLAPKKVYRVIKKEAI